MASKAKYNRRRYGVDTVIYTSKEGHVLTITPLPGQEDTWKKAGELLTLLNKQ